MSTYTCENCGGTFEDGWSEEQATAEFNRIFPGKDQADTARLCDDCWRQCMAWAERMGLIENGKATQ